MLDVGFLAMFGHLLLVFAADVCPDRFDGPPVLSKCIAKAYEAFSYFLGPLGLDIWIGIFLVNLGAIGLQNILGSRPVRLSKG